MGIHFFLSHSPFAHSAQVWVFKGTLQNTHATPGARIVHPIHPLIYSSYNSVASVSLVVPFVLRLTPLAEVWINADGGIHFNSANVASGSHSPITMPL